jgi:SAM-dependent methyltransferase
MEDRMDFTGNRGYCSICEADTQFIVKHPWLRDFYVCEKCGTCPRQRAVAEILTWVRPHWRKCSIHESSPCIPFFEQQCPLYTKSYYFEEIPVGSLDPAGRRCENLEYLTFPDETFDIFITQDVLEHVFNPDKALAEIMRVLRTGGLHIFTAPKHKGILKTYQRARLNNGQVEHLHEANYHGNPIADGRSLVTWDYGADFDDLIQQWSGYNTCNYIIRDRRRGIDGEYLDVFVTVKEPLNRLK